MLIVAIFYRYADIVMLNVVMLNVIMLNVIMLSGEAPYLITNKEPNKLECNPFKPSLTFASKAEAYTSGAVEKYSQTGLALDLTGKY
jgi:hypothetical protein